ncbi:hypothetical protein [Nocardioides sp.]
MTNARTSAVACSRGRVEREEVAAYLADHAHPAAGAPMSVKVWIAHSG